MNLFKKFSDDFWCCITNVVLAAITKANLCLLQEQGFGLNENSKDLCGNKQELASSGGSKRYRCGACSGSRFVLDTKRKGFENQVGIGFSVQLEHHSCPHCIYCASRKV